MSAHTRPDAFDDVLLALKELIEAVRELVDRPEAGFFDLHLRRAEVSVARALARSARSSETGQAGSTTGI